ncbi:alkylated DNA nucleotide flippase Atl1 [Arthrobacter stackebrandtii]|uniref:Alkylated DNA nucleotide flippase Atl1 n=1 Tax=Arthrobacter stackebrandtii TaxID=272161 RepID=A0ABS4YZH5_9MICC|nr:alkylated DNA nucleotide flippase Atl1 [Arthrobacter stackebrandtii]
MRIEYLSIMPEDPQAARRLPDGAVCELSHVAAMVGSKTRPRRGAWLVLAG